MFFRPKLLIPPGKEDLFAYYRMQLLWDGYPGAAPTREPNARPHPHPLYGVYLIRMSLEEWRRSGNPDFLHQALRTGKRAIKRMRRHRGALIFDYVAKTPFNRTGRVFYSALTQAKYISAFSMLEEVTGNPLFGEAARGCLESLMVPLGEGGILVERPQGISLEESPHLIPSFILNGWLSVLENVARYAQATKSAAAQSLVDRSVPRLVHLLPHYDMPELKTSRYALAGTVPFRVQLPEGARIVSAATTPPYGGKVDFEFTWRPTKWSLSITSGGDGNMIVSHEPGERQSLVVVVKAKRAGTARLMAPTIDYDPVLGTTYSKSWSAITSADVVAGMNTIVFDTLLDSFGAVAGATNFKKKIAGRQCNSYHVMHVKSLRRLHEITGEPVFRDYADKWQQYTKEWPTMPIYAGKNLALDPFGHDRLPHTI